MLWYSLRALKRFVVLLPGVAIAYFSVHTVFPYFDRRLPLAFAIFATYILGAYVLIPALIRVVRLVRPPKHLPLYCVTPDGFASDPLNIGVVATRRQLITAMEEVGWLRADPHNWRYSLQFIVRGLLGQPYPNAPVSNLYLFGRKQDLAFVQALDDSLTRRHHVRFWIAPNDEVGSRSPLAAVFHRKSEPGKAGLWVGAASLDAGAAIIRHNFQLSHMIHPDTNAERELILKQLKAAKLVRRTETIVLSRPYRLVNRVWRGYLNSDGKMTVAHLR